MKSSDLITVCGRKSFNSRDKKVLEADNFQLCGFHTLHAVLFVRYILFHFNTIKMNLVFIGDEK